MKPMKLSQCVWTSVVNTLKQIPPFIPISLPFSINFPGPRVLETIFEWHVSTEPFLWFDLYVRQVSIAFVRAFLRDEPVS